MECHGDPGRGRRLDDLNRTLADVSVASERVGSAFAARRAAIAALQARVLLLERVARAALHPERVAARGGGDKDTRNGQRSDDTARLEYGHGYFFPRPIFSKRLTSLLWAKSSSS